ncbi:MAG: NAD(+) kinase [Ramalina farinacea]|uniref:NAD(+) kinase n=1 Tax=Ramalina farinacea TaxID=258253 RepID=A0AA43TRA4_9LECA|nr:NAD(+) kinase [Ramalina farinacea]
MAESSSKKESGVESYKPDEDAPKPIPRRSSTLGSTLLRDYRTHLDPLNTNDVTTMSEDIQSLTPTAKTGNPLQDVLKLPPSSPPRSVPSPKAFLGTGIKPTTSISPHRSMLRTLASRSSQESLRQERSSLEGPNPPPSFAARFLHTPCFFHQRFEDAVNVDRVLEEVAAEGDDNMSTSRLMQTATSVREISKQLQRRPIKRAVRNIMIVTKARDNYLVYLTRELTQWLLSKPRYSSEVGVCVYVDAKLRNSKRFDAPGLLASNPRFEPMLRYWTPDMCMTSPERFDLVLTLGGDGTVLYTSWLFQRIVPPILSFSLGSLGFLTNFAFANYKPTLDRIMEGAGMRVNMRMRFTCTIYRAQPGQNRRSSKTSNSSNLSSARQSISSASAPPSISASSTAATAPSSTTSTAPSMTSSSPASLTPESTFEVLNELVLDRGPSPYVSNLELYGDTHLLTIIQADGVIISTPTGSTAYSLSAGGPLTHPSIPGILLTPICPHTLSFRPMVLSDTLLLRLVVPKHSRGGAYASFDGKGRVELRRGDEVRVEVGRYPFPTVVGEGGTGGEWFESVRRALRWNTRGAVQGGFGSRVNAGEIGEEEEEGWKLGDEGQDEEEGLERQEEQWDIDADPIDEGDLIGPLETGGGAGTSEVGHGGGEQDSAQKGKDPGCALD